MPPLLQDVPKGHEPLGLILDASELDLPITWASPDTERDGLWDHARVTFLETI